MKIVTNLKNYILHLLVFVFILNVICQIHTQEPASLKSTAANFWKKGISAATSLWKSGKKYAPTLSRTTDVVAGASAAAFPVIYQFTQSNGGIPPIASEITAGLKKLNINIPVEVIAALGLSLAGAAGIALKRLMVALATDDGNISKKVYTIQSILLTLGEDSQLDFFGSECDKHIVKEFLYAIISSAKSNLHSESSPKTLVTTKKEITLNFFLSRQAKNKKKPFLFNIIIKRVPPKEPKLSAEYKVTIPENKETYDITTDNKLNTAINSLLAYLNSKDTSKLSQEEEEEEETEQ
jgi:hypothetical protein